MKRKTFVILSATLCVAPLVLYSWLFDVPKEASINMVFNQNLMTISSPCYEVANPKFLDANGRVNLAVWNLYKQKLDDWQPFLSDLASDKQLVLLQEVALDDGFVNWLTERSIFAVQANAFRVNGHVAGVLNLSQSQPKKVCVTRAIEPWIQLPKSALYSLFPLSNGQSLALVNIHSINFSIGVEEYLEQIKELAKKLSHHVGPIIFAGDFNTWSDSRMRVLKDIMKDLELSEVVFNQDLRTRFMNGLVLDHIFFRGLKVTNSKIIPTTASDHNPLVVSFDLRPE